MSEAQLMHATKMAQGEEQYQGKLLEARQSDWKDEAVLIILSLPVVVLAWAVISDDPTAMDKVKLFFEMFSQLPSWFTNLWILVVASIYGIKGTQIFRNGGKNNVKEKRKLKRLLKGLGVGAAILGAGKALMNRRDKANQMKEFLATEGGDLSNMTTRPNMLDIAGPIVRDISKTKKKKL